MAPAGATPRLAANHLGSQLFSGKYQRKDVLFPQQSPDITAFGIGKGLLRSALMKTTGQVLFVGHSFAARIAAGLLRDEADGDTAFRAACPPERVVFVFTGNPERKYNGACNIPGSLIIAAYGGNGVPLDTDYRVYDVARQYEFFADHPNDRSNRKALSNAGKGFGLHLDYSEIFMGDPSYARVTEGNITYVLAPTYPMPEAKKLFWGVARECQEDDKIRAEVERAYTRPFTLSKPTLSPVTGAKGRVAYNPRTRLLQPAKSAPAWNPFG